MIETLGRIDNGERSIRVERSRFDSVHGPRSVLLITTYRRLRNGTWCRERSVTVRRAELEELGAMLGGISRLSTKNGDARQAQKE